MRNLSISKCKNNVDKIKYDFFVFDVETTCLEPQPKNFVFGCMVGHKTKKVFKTVEEFKEEFALPKYKKKYLFAHNAEFDLLTIFGNIFLKIDNAAIFNGKFVAAKYNDVTFADSMNIYPTSVEKLGHLIGLNKMTNDKVKTGGLNKNNITQHDIDYCMTDCIIVYKALLKIFEMTGVIRITLPSLSMFDFRHNYLEQNIPFSELVDEFYESYYGGRTEAFYIGNTDAKVYDINSMYPAAMRNVKLPDVKKLNKTENCDISFLMYCLKFCEGMACITVIHKETYFGYLPCRMELNGGTKLVFPVGEFKTTVNFNELRFALESGVIEIKKVHKVIYGAPVESIFTKYIDYNFEMRRNAKDELERTIYKLKMNSLYGKFAMRLKMTTTYYEQIPYNLIEALKEDEMYCDIKLFNSSRCDCFLVTENDKFKNSFFSIPTISSYITSEARVYLLKHLIANENNGIVYCDTDSIFLTGSFSGSISDRLGDFKLEEKKVTQIKGLKNYIYIDKDGKTNVVIKGICRGSKQEKATVAGEETYSSQRYIKTKASLRQNKEAGTAYTMVKTVRNNYDKREILKDGNTRALISRNGILINATRFIRPKIRKVKKKRFDYVPQNVTEAVMMFFVQGGKVCTADMRAHVTGKSNKELKLYFGLYEKDGMRMDVFNDYIPVEYYTDRIIDVFQDVLLRYNTTTKMREFLEERKREYDEHQAAIKKQVTEYIIDYDTPF